MCRAQRAAEPRRTAEALARLGALPLRRGRASERSRSRACEGPRSMPMATSRRSTLRSWQSPAGSGRPDSRRERAEGAAAMEGVVNAEVSIDRGGCQKARPNRQESLSSPGRWDAQEEQQQQAGGDRGATESLRLGLAPGDALHPGSKPDRSEQQQDGRPAGQDNRRREQNQRRSRWFCSPARVGGWEVFRFGLEDETEKARPCAGCCYTRLHRGQRPYSSI